MSDRQGRRRGRGWRIALIALAVVVLVPLAGLAVLALTFDPDSLKPRIEHAVKRATGRDLALRGPLSLKFSLRPTVEARDVAFANIEGGSRPAMATLERLEAQFALLPLLRRSVEIERVVLVHPDILLEADAQGRPNWRFGPETPSQPLPEASAAPPPAGAKAEPLAIDLREVDVEGGRITWRDGRTGRAVPIDIKDAAVRADGANGPIRLALHAAYAGAGFALTGEAASLAGLRERAAPWPLRLTLAAAAGATVNLDGALAPPPGGLQGKLTGAVPDLAALAPFARGAPLPPVRDIRAAAEIADAGGALAVSGLTVRAGAADLGPLVPGLRLASLEADAPGTDGPVRFAVNGAWREAAFTAVGSLSREGASGATVRDFSLANPAGAVKGEIAAGWGGRPSLRATLAADRIDLDALLPTLRPPPEPKAAGNPAPAPGPAPAAPGPAPGNRVISDRPIPFAALRLADADLRLSAATVRSGGQDYHDAAAHLVLAGGRLGVDPLGARLPAGRLDGRLTVDATGPDAAVALTLRGPGLQAGPLLALLRLPAEAQGAVDVDADLRGTGNSPHALAATADGHLGLAMVNGAIDNRLVSGTLGQVLQHARLPDVTAHPGSLPVRCLAVRLDAHAGVGDVRALLLDTSLFYVEGGGSVNLGDETLALRLRPLARLGGTGVIVPLRVGGGWRSPKVEVDAAGAAGAAAGAAAEAARSPQLGIIIGALGIDRSMPGAGAGDCGKELALARGGLPGPSPAGPEAPARNPPAPKERAPKPADLLRQFLR